MKVVNILLNYNRANHNNKVLGVERCFVDYSKYLVLKGVEVVSVIKSKIFLLDEIKKTNSQIVELPAYFDASNVKLVCSKCGKATRVGYEISKEKEGKRSKSRVCKKCGQLI